MLNGGVLGDCRQCEARFLREGQGPVSGPLLGSRGNDPLWSRGRSPWKYHHFSLFRGCNESKFKTLCLHWGEVNVTVLLSKRSATIGWRGAHEENFGILDLPDSRKWHLTGLKAAINI